MGQVLHGSARTTHAIRGELQRSQVSVASLAKRYGINEKTVLKWRHRQSVEDLPMGPKERRSTVLSPMEEAAIVALRVQARLPLDDVYIALKDVIPHLTRSSLHRCLQRHGISACQKPTARSPRRLSITRSATSTSTLPSCAMRAGRASCSSRWIAPQSWSSPASTARPPLAAI
jgi:transposase-like protein